MYIRFFVYQEIWKSKHRLGVFAAAWELLENHSISAEDRAQLAALMEWFRLNLPVPELNQWTHRAIFWYKPSAKLHIRRTWEIVSILTANGYHVDMIKTAFTGRAVHEDKFQIGAIPPKSATDYSWPRST